MFNSKAAIFSTDAVQDSSVKLYRRSALSDLNMHDQWSRTTERQGSWAIAKKTARCAQYMGALKSFQSPHYAPDDFKFVTDFCSDRY